MKRAHRNILAVLMAASTLSAQASTITYNFIIDWIGADWVNSSSSGSVTVDAALALPGASYKRPDLLTDFQFSFQGKAFALQDVTTGYLSFDDAGRLQALGVGTDCKPGICYAYSGQPASLAISYFATQAPDMFFASIGNPAGLTVNGQGRFSVVSSVPEPTTVALFAFGLGGVALASRRRRSSRPQVVNDA